MDPPGLGLEDGNTSGIAHAVANPSKYDLFIKPVDQAVAQADPLDGGGA